MSLIFQARFHFLSLFSRWIASVRFNARGEIAGHADVQGSVGFVGKDVDHWLLHARSNGVPAFAGTTVGRSSHRRI